MRRRLLFLTPLAVGASAVALAACGGGGSSGGTNSSSGGYQAAATPVPAHAARKAATAKLTIGTGSSKLGTLVTGAGGRTVYLFEKDRHGRSMCSGSCASIWPPVTLHSGAKPVAGGRVSARLLGTTARQGGVRQVTYAGHPLYYYVGDQRRGDANGEGLDQFGAEWYVLSSKGTKIDHDS
jgi:predicted lipoprotein with Yx(FWY)xxD motif